MNPVGDPMIQRLWQVVTGKEQPSAHPQEQYVLLKNEILRVEFDITGRLLEATTVPDHLIDTYVSREVVPSIERYDEEYEVDSERSLGSTIIQKMKGLRTPPESPTSLTYEHLLVERIATPRQNIVLVGDTGSGKTHMLKFISTCYIDPLVRDPIAPDGMKVTRCKLWLDVDPKQCETKDTLFTHLCIHLEQALEQTLGDKYYDAYRDFVKTVFSRRREDGLPYLDTLRWHGLREGVNPISIMDLHKEVAPALRLDLVRYVLAFCGYVRDRWFGKEHLRMFLVLDNIDTSPRPVQDALVNLLMDATPRMGILILCACRPETLINWDSRRGLLDVIPHIGASAHDVLVKRFSDFTGAPPDEEHLRDRLQGKRKPAEFLNNLVDLTGMIKRAHFRSFFDGHFGWRVRDGIVFGQGIVDLAAGWSSQGLKEHVLRSAYATERHLFRPWGLETRAPHVINVFDQGPRHDRRLGALRVIVYLHPKRPYSESVQDVCDWMDFFGYDKKEVVGILEQMLKCGILLVASAERNNLGESGESAKERMRLTKTGQGLWEHAYQFGYTSTVMYYTHCKGECYAERIEEAFEPDLQLSGQILREFIRETWDFEKKEIAKFLSGPGVDAYNAEYGGRTLCQEFLRCGIVTLAKIAEGERSRTKMALSELLGAIDYYRSDLALVENTMEVDWKLGQTVGGKDFLEALKIVEVLRERVSGSASEPESSQET
jgi:hypothetical protein